MVHYVVKSGQLAGPCRFVGLVSSDGAGGHADGCSGDGTGDGLDGLCAADGVPVQR